MSTSDRPVTVRLPEDDLAQMMGLCVVDDSTLADQLRRAVTQYLDLRRSSPDFEAEVAAARDRQTKALDALQLAK